MPSLGKDAQPLRIEHFDLTLPAAILQLTSKQIEVQDFKLKTSVANLSVDGSVDIENTHFDNVQLKANDIDLDFFRTLLDLHGLVSGQANLDATLSGNLDQPEFHTDLQIETAEDAGAPFDHLHIQIDYPHTQDYPQLKGQVVVRQQEHELLNLNLEQPAKLTWGDFSPDKILVDAPVNLNLKIGKSAFKTWQWALPILPPLDGTVSANVDLKGPYNQLQLESQLHLEQMALEDMLKDANASFDLSGTVITAPSFSALLEVLIGGTFSLAVRDLSLQAESIEVLVPSLGKDAQPLRIDKLEFRADALTSDRATLIPFFLPDDVQVQLDTLYIESDPITLDAGGSLSGKPQDALTYTLTLNDLTAIRQQFDLDLDATGQIRGEISGPLEALRTKGILTLNDWRYGTWRGEAFNAKFSARDLNTRLQAELQEAEVVGFEGPSVPPSRVALNGSYKDQEQAQFDVHVTEGPFQKTRITGEAALEAGQDLTLTTLNLQRGDWQWSNARPIRVIHDAQGSIEVADFELRNGQQAILANAMLPQQGPITGNVRIDQLHIPSNAKPWLPDTSVPDGYVQLDINLKGTRQALGAEGALKLTDLAWQRRPLGELEAQLDMVNNTLTSDVLWRDQQTELLSLQGTVGLDAAGALNVTVPPQTFDLARLPSYTEAIAKSAGELDLDLRLSGTTSQPVINGKLAVIDGMLQLPVLGEPYTDIQTTINFAGNRISLEQLDIGSKTGTLNLQGWLELAGAELKALDFSMAANNFTAIQTQDIEARLNSNLSAKGSLDALTVNGNVTIPRAKIRVEGLLGGGPATVKPEQLTVEGVYGTGKQAAASKDGSESAPNQADSLPFLKADVKIDMPRNVWVQAKGTAVELNANLHVTKALHKPLLVAGDINTVRGFASYLGKKFTLDQGRITFTGAEDINPTLDITANHKVSGYVVTINVQGTSKLPKINLSSAPDALEEADIISLLVFGRTQDKLTGSEQGSLANSAQNAALGRAAGAAASAVGQQVGLDSVEVEVGEEAKVGTGKYITQDIFLSYERQLGKEPGNTVGVEYSINERLKLKGSSSSTGETAVDLIWRKDY